VPTAADFDQAATALDAAADGTAAVLDSIAGTELDDVLRGGTLRTTVEAALTVSSANVLAAVAQLRAAAEEARFRADECRNFAAQVRAFHADLFNLDGVSDSDDPPPRYPTKPYPWIEL
jgi:hypothetical protein